MCEPIVRLAAGVRFEVAFWRVRTKAANNVNRLACFPQHSIEAQHLQCSECCSAINVEVAGVYEQLSGEMVRSLYRVTGEFSVQYKAKNGESENWTTPEQTVHEAEYMGRVEGSTPPACMFRIRGSNAFPFEMVNMKQARYTVNLHSIQEDGEWKVVSSHSSSPFIVRHMHKSSFGYPDSTVKLGRPPIRAQTAAATTVPTAVPTAVPTTVPRSSNSRSSSAMSSDKNRASAPSAALAAAKRARLEARRGATPPSSPPAALAWNAPYCVKGIQTPSVLEADMSKIDFEMKATFKSFLSDITSTFPKTHLELLHEHHAISDEHNSKL